MNDKVNYLKGVFAKNEREYRLMTNWIRFRSLHICCVPFSPDIYIATNESKINSDRNRIQFDTSLNTHFHFSRTLPSSVSLKRDILEFLVLVLNGLLDSKSKKGPQSPKKSKILLKFSTCCAFSLSVFSSSPFFHSWIWSSVHCW